MKALIVAAIFAAVVIVSFWSFIIVLVKHY